jgi:hypothetical protein
MIGQELHKIGRRDRKIPISKIGRTAWQNQTDSKNQTDFGFSCKQENLKKFFFENFLNVQLRLFDKI